MHLIKFIIFISFSFITNYIKYLFGSINSSEFTKNIIGKIGEYNVVFLKLLQWICVKKDSVYFNKESIDFINKYTNKTPYTNEDIDWKLIAETLCYSNFNKDILTFDSFEPINSGTISLVFKGKLNDKPIAIKILRKNILNNINIGINLLESIFYILNLFKLFNDLHFNRLLENTKPEIYSQIDFESEINNLIKFKSNFSKNKVVVIPGVYCHYTVKLKNIIVMDWIDGYNINFLDPKDCKNACNFFIKYIFSSYIYKGIVHGDLHQGNVIFIKDKINDQDVFKIGLIDFGTILELDTDEINLSCVFIDSFFNRDLDKLQEYILNYKNCIFEDTQESNILKVITKMNDLKEKNILFIQNNYVTDDIVLFLKIIKNNNCIIKNKIYRIIMSLIPLTYIIENICEKGEHVMLINEQFAKIKNKFAI